MPDEKTDLVDVPEEKTVRDALADLVDAADADFGRYLLERARRLTEGATPLRERGDTFDLECAWLWASAAASVAAATCDDRLILEATAMLATLKGALGRERERAA